MSARHTQLTVALAAAALLGAGGHTGRTLPSPGKVPDSERAKWPENKPPTEAQIQKRIAKAEAKRARKKMAAQVEGLRMAAQNKDELGAAERWLALPEATKLRLIPEARVDKRHITFLDDGAKAVAASLRTGGKE